MRTYLPPQHGAWAMLLVPYLIGLLCAGVSWLHLPLLVAWLAGYLLSYYSLLAVKARGISRVRPQLMLYAAMALPATLLTVAPRPALLGFAPAYAALFAVNAGFAWARRDRALLNDLALVLQGCLMVPVAAVVAGAAASTVMLAFVLVLLYFVGTVFYVKTMIRNRGDTGYLRASIAYHAGSAAVVTAMAWPLGPVYAWFLVRAVVLPRRTLAPKQVGVLEIVNSVVLLVTIPVLGS